MKKFKKRNLVALFAFCSIATITVAPILASCKTSQNDSINKTETAVEADRLNELIKDVTFKNDSYEFNEINSWSPDNIIDQIKGLTLDKNKFNYNVIDYKNNEKEQKITFYLEISPKIVFKNSTKTELEKIQTNLIEIKYSIKLTELVPPVSPEKPNPPVDPKPPVNPKPPVDPKPPVTNKNFTISIKNENQTIASQLVDLNTKDLKLDSFDIKYDNAKITNPKYILKSFNDKTGNLSFDVEYNMNNKKNVENFTFNNLSKLNSSKISIYPKKLNNGIFVGIVTNTTAYDASQKEIKTNDEALDFIKKLEVDNVIKIELLNSIYNLPWSYFVSEGLKISGFQNSWYTDNKNLSLTYTFINPKLNYYVLTNSSNDIKKEILDWPAGNKLYFTLDYLSGADYILQTIEAKSENDSKVDKYPHWVYGDLKYNKDAIESELRLLSPGGVLQDGYLTSFPNQPTLASYKPIFNTRTSSDFDNFNLEDSSFDIDISVQISNNNNTQTIKSLYFKTIKVKNLLKYPENIFNTTASNTFVVTSNPNKWDDNLSKLKSKQFKDKIVQELDKINNNPTIKRIPITTINHNDLQQIFSINKESFIFEFANEKLELIQPPGNNDRYWYNEFIFIDFINMTDLLLVYDNENKHFSVEFNISFSSDSQTWKSETKFLRPITKRIQIDEFKNS